MMKMKLSGGDLGGTDAEFQTGKPGETLDLELEGRVLRYEVREYRFDGRKELVANFVGYVDPA